MDTDRQKELESPLIEDFLDCDQLASDSDGESSGSASPRRSLKRLHIHLDMTNTQYLTPAAHLSERSRIDSLPVCSSGPPTVAFSSPGLDPYSAVSGVSSFNYPAAADPSLLTPVSSAGSPPLPHKQSAKQGRNYQSPAPPSQAPTPPNTSKMYYDSYGVSSSSQGSSPMTVDPTVTEAGAFEMAYMSHSPPVSHHPSSPKSEMTPPIDPYLGHFTVSGANDGEVTHSLPDYHTYGVAHPGAYLGQHHVPVSAPHMHHRMPSNGTAPVLSQPHPTQFRPSTAQVGAIEDLRDPSMLMGAYPSHPSLSPGRRPPSKKKTSPARKASRTPKTTPHIGPDINGNFKPEEEEEELVLNDDAPEDDKFLFQLRKQFISEKGKGMWEEMKAKYAEKHQGNWEKAALQMKVSRAVAKYGVWPEKEIERLREAWHYFEDKRYQLIIARMKENGGCRAWDWKPAHIELMLIKLGMEEPTVNEKTGSRRRRQQKAAARRQASPHLHNQQQQQQQQQQNGLGGQQQQAAAAAAAGIMGSDWGSGLGLQHAFHNHAHAHQVAAQMNARQQQQQQYLDGSMMGGEFPPHAAPQPQPQPQHSSNLTAAQEEDLISEVFSKVKAERSLSPDESMDGLSYEAHGSRRPSAVAVMGGGQGQQQQQHRELDHQGSERVARGTCQQLLGGGGYGGQ